MNKQEEERKLSIQSIVFGLISSGATIFITGKYILKPIEQLFNYHISFIAKFIGCGVIVLISIGIARGMIIKQKAMENLAFKK